MSGTLWLTMVDTADLVGSTLAYFVNIVLLGLIKTRGKNLGTYKYLMGFFSFFSMFYAIVESVLRPIMHIENSTFFLISRKLFDYSTRLGKINSAFYCACFATSFVVSAVHFIYRYFASCRPTLLHYFEYPFIFMWLLGGSVPVIAWASVSYFLYPDTEETEAGVKYVLATHYQSIEKKDVSYIAYVYYYYEKGERRLYIKNLMGCFVHYFVMSMTFAVVFYCGFSTWKSIRQNRRASDKTRQLQHQLFKALVLQTTVPSIFMYIPTGVMFIAPFFDVNLNANANFIVFCSFIYPGLDPLILILIIRQFRETIFRFIRRNSIGKIESQYYSTSRIVNTIP